MSFRFPPTSPRELVFLQGSKSYLPKTVLGNRARRESPIPSHLPRDGRRSRSNRRCEARSRESPLPRQIPFLIPRSTQYGHTRVPFDLVFRVEQSSHS